MGTHEIKHSVETKENQKENYIVRTGKTNKTKKPKEIALSRYLYEIHLKSEKK